MTEKDLQGYRYAKVWINEDATKKERCFEVWAFRKGYWYNVWKAIDSVVERLWPEDMVEYVKLVHQAVFYDKAPVFPEGGLR